MHFSNIIDTPRAPGDIDLLGVDKYVDALAEFVAVAQMPTTLAIQGEWGSGKTSLMNQVRYRLCEMPGELEPDKPYYGIWINTWQYSMMRNKEETLVNVIKGITSEALRIMNRHKGSLSGAMSKVGGMFGKLAKIGAKAAASAAGVDTNLVDELTGQSDARENAEAFRAALADALAVCLQEDARQGSKKKGFIFFIDDLDRLDPPVAVEILELLKNLFEVENCIFILAIDYDVVVKGLEPKFGPLTAKNEREFRSFFDKIIQLPFSMPVNSYNMDSFLAESLANIGFFNKEELAEHIGPENEASLEVISELAILSVGSNPRSVKRLINSLSLVRIMRSISNGDSLLSIREKILSFAFLCIQIAWPTIYEMLLFEPDYKKWNDKTASRFRGDPIDASIKDKLDGTEEFDEPWEQALFRVCHANPYLRSRAFSISRMLNYISTLFEDSADFGAEVSRILAFAAVTTVSSGDAAARKIGSRQRAESMQDFIASCREAGVSEESINIMVAINDKILAQYGNLVKAELIPGRALAYHVANNKSRERRLAKMDLRKGGVSIYTGDYGPFIIKTLVQGANDSLPADFFKQAYKRFKQISSDKAPAFLE